MDPITTEQRDGATVVTLTDGKANAIGSRMLGALIETAESLAGQTGGVVLTGTGRFFSAGLDLVEMAATGRAQLEPFLERFNRMCDLWFTLPRPVVAAVNGHAVAGGAVLALTADRVLIADGPAKIGLTETPLGIVFPASALEVVRYHLTPAAVPRVLLAGEMFAPSDAVGVGLAQALVPADALLARAVALASQLGQLPALAYGKTKAALRRTAMRAIADGRAESDRAFLDSICDDATRSRILAQLDAMKSRKS